MTIREGMELRKLKRQLMLIERKLKGEKKAGKRSIRRYKMNNKKKKQGECMRDFDNMTMFEQQQYINEYVLKQLDVDSIEVDSTAFENPQVKESDGRGDV